ncbi:MAG: metal ABC transporter substrate-binding protein [Archaeoglobaceae archaeon]
MSLWKAYTFVLILFLSTVDARVIVSLPDFETIVERITGEDVDVLMPSSVDPHMFSISYQDIKKIENAQLVVLANSELISFEGEIKKICKKCIDFKDYNPTILNFPGFGENIHAYWLYPDNAIKIALKVKDVLSELNAEKAEIYNRNFENFVLSLEIAKRDSEKLVSGVKNLKFVAIDPHVAYAISALNLSVFSILFSEDIAPNAFRIEELRKIAGDCVLVIGDYQLETKLGEIAEKTAQEYNCRIAEISVFSNLSYEAQLLKNAISISNSRVIEKKGEEINYFLAFIAVIEAMIVVILWSSRRRI